MEGSLLIYNLSLKLRLEVVMILCAPGFINWNLTFTCNFMCQHCYSKSDDEFDILSTEECFEIVDHFSNANVFEVNLGGGECLIRKDLFQIIKRLRDKNIVVDLTSNGWLIDEECAAKLKEVDTSFVYLSLDSVNPDTHDDIRNRKGSFERVVRAAKLLKKYEVPFAFMTVVMRQNRHEIFDMCEFIKKLEPTHWSLKKFRPVGNGLVNNQKLQLTEEEHMETMEVVRKLAENEKDLKLRFTYSDYPISKLSQGCACGKSSMAIKPNGDMLMCVYGEKILGNIFHDNLSDVWTNHPTFIKKRTKGKCEAMSRDYSEYKVDENIKIVNNYTSNSKGLYEAILSNDYNPCNGEESPIMVKNNDKEYSLNVASSIVFESILKGDPIYMIVLKFSKVFSDLDSVNYREDIVKSLEDMSKIGVINR